MAQLQDGVRDSGQLLHVVSQNDSFPSDIVERAVERTAMLFTASTGTDIRSVPQRGKVGRQRLVPPDTIRCPDRGALPGLTPGEISPNWDTAPVFQYPYCPYLLAKI